MNEFNENHLKKEGEICLLNDSFPPLIDGVANTVVNYAGILKKEGVDVSVVTPAFPGIKEIETDYPVLRYPSFDLRKLTGYTAGNPFDIPTLLELKKRDIRLLHSHCPAASNTLARSLREAMDIPFIMTYHTKFDVDIANIIKLKGLQTGVIRALVDSVSACDEVWVVSDGAGQNIRSLGYQGDYIVMPNGVDIKKGRVPEEEIIKATEGYDLPENVPVFLFVGRLMWYKGLKIILDALSALRSQNMDFRMVIIGGGQEEEEIRAYTENSGLSGKVFFTGPLHDRALLSAWYCRADLLLFPSTFDTNGLVVREAAACALGTVLVKGSCAAEGVANGKDGLLIEENAASLAVCLARVMENHDAMRSIGENAANDLYYSWEDAVHRAMERYEIVIDGYKSGKYQKHRHMTDEFFNISGELLDFIAAAEEKRKHFTEKLERYW